ncbi:unnamed protein product, partial [Protopolystoma xenopodis]
MQLRLCDPFGHSGFSQETPQLILSLLSDMLQLDWLPGASGIAVSCPQTGCRKPASRSLSTHSTGRDASNLPSKPSEPVSSPLGSNELAITVDTVVNTPSNGSARKLTTSDNITMGCVLIDKTGHSQLTHCRGLCTAPTSAPLPSRPLITSHPTTSTLAGAVNSHPTFPTTANAFLTPQSNPLSSPHPAPTEVADHSMSFQAVIPPILPGGDCCYCHDVGAWWQAAVLLCQHLAPASPPPWPEVELNAEKIVKITKFKEVRTWRCVTCTDIAIGTAPQAASCCQPSSLVDFTSKKAEPSNDAFEVTYFPTLEELMCLPSIIRVIYQLVRCLYVPKAASSVSPAANSLMKSTAQRMHSTTSSSTHSRSGRPSLPQSSLGSCSTAKKAAASLSASSILTELDTGCPPVIGRLFSGQVLLLFSPPRDPVRLQAVIECLSFLFRVGDALTLVFKAAERAVVREAAAAAAAASASSSTAGGFHTLGSS